MCYPEYKIKVHWDLMITIVLIVSCIQTPIDIAFNTESGPTWTFNDVLGLIIDLLFLMDIIINFFSAYELEEGVVVENRK